MLYTLFCYTYIEMYAVIIRVLNLITYGDKSSKFAALILGLYILASQQIPPPKKKVFEKKTYPSIEFTFY